MNRLLNNPATETCATKLSETQVDHSPGAVKFPNISPDSSWHSSPCRAYPRHAYYQYSKLVTKFNSNNSTIKSIMQCNSLQKCNI